MVQAITFGPFRLLPVQRTLFEDGRPLRLGSRALDILIALADSAGELVSKDELVARVWPKTFVEEANLRVHIAALRKALGDGQAGTRYIMTVPGRGYCLVAPVERLDEKDSLAAPYAEAEQTHNLPAPLTRMIGRAEIVAALAEQLLQRRFVTVVGPGGIGKTTVALAVADRLIASYADGVRFVDLTPLTDHRLVPNVLAFVLGFAVHSEDPVSALTSYLRHKQMLLVFDSCEHVIEAAAPLAEEVLKGAPGVHILATSRESLRAEGETVQRLAPLAVPPASKGLTAAEALAFPAVRLFVERASASVDAFELSDADAPVVADICRRLDGIALAIELTAGRIDAFGVRGLAALLNDRFRLLTSGRRTALPRHQTLGATLDWSHELLPDAERLLLRRLAVFAGDFTPESASVVASGAGIAASEVFDLVASLVAKSLVSADIGGDIVHYRLLDTTCAYALEKLIASGEYEALARRHAEYHYDLLERAAAETETRLAAYAPQIDDVRSALDWAYSKDGDLRIAVALTAAAMPLWSEMSLLGECRAAAERALGALASMGNNDQRRRMQLCAALALVKVDMDTTESFRETDAAWQTAFEIAETLGDTDYQLRALWGMWGTQVKRGEFVKGLAFARRFFELAEQENDINDRLVGDRITGATLHFLGDLAGARAHIERVLASYVTPTGRSHAVRFQADQLVLARTYYARILWLQGYPDQAMSTAETAVKDAIAIDHPASLCNTLGAAACPIALWIGDLSTAERYTTMLLELTGHDILDAWRTHADCLDGELLIKRGDLSGGLKRLRASIDYTLRSGVGHYTVSFLGALADGFAAAGKFSQAETTIDDAIVRSERSGAHWCIAELLRIKGAIILQIGTAGAAVAAEEQFLRSLDLAGRQEARSWELRAATSLAQLRRDQGRMAEGYDLLMSVYRRFGEGHETLDLHVAANLLDELSSTRR